VSFSHLPSWSVAARSTGNGIIVTTLDTKMFGKFGKLPAAGRLPGRAHEAAKLDCIKSRAKMQGGVTVESGDGVTALPWAGKAWGGGVGEGEGGRGHAGCGNEQGRWKGRSRTSSKAKKRLRARLQTSRETRNSRKSRSEDQARPGIEVRSCSAASSTMPATIPPTCQHHIVCITTYTTHGIELNSAVFMIDLPADRSLSIASALSFA
jgi:hypothetical protein